MKRGDTTTSMESDMSAKKKMNRVSVRVAVLAVTALALLVSATHAANATAAARFDVKASWAPSSLPPGGEARFEVQTRNLGDSVPEETVVISDELPEGAVVSGISFLFPGGLDLSILGWCHGVGTRVATCEVVKIPEVFFFNQWTSPRNSELHPEGYLPVMVVKAEVDPSATGTGTNVATVGEEGQGVQATHTEDVSFDSKAPSFGLRSGSYLADVFDAQYPDGSPTRKSSDRPYELRVNFDFNAGLGSNPDGTLEPRVVGSVKTVEVTLPRGLVGNPEATPKCDPADYLQAGVNPVGSTGCPPDTQVGVIDLKLVPGGSKHGFAIFNNPDGAFSRVAVYNMKPPKGVPADLVFNAGGMVQGHIYPELDPAQNYAIKTVTPNISSLITARGADVSIWGVPGDPAHAKLRYFSQPGHTPALTAPYGAAIRPFLTNPMDCGFDNGGSRIRIESYNEPGKMTPVEEWHEPLNVSGCDDPRIRFEPKISLQPDNRDAGGPTGLDVHLEVPQRNDVATDAKELYPENGFVKGIATPPMKKVVTTFPEGMTLSPSAAQGLGTCTAEQISLGTNKPVTCPDNSQYGKLILHTPILPVDSQPEGFIYIAKQGDNPFHNFLALYLVIQEPDRGILVKLPGRLDLDPQTGQITTTFDDLPQLPVSDMQLKFKGGVRAGLVNPTTCGTKTIRAEFFSWHDPTTPHVVDSNYEITNKPDGSPCVPSLGQRPFAPTMNAGTLSPTAGQFSPFAFRVSRTDEDQEFSQIGVKLPEGLAAKFAGVGTCSDAGIARALSRETTAGAAALEEADPSCPASSEIGSTIVGTGVGVPLSWVPGKIYLAGPYKGAPMSMVVISPAKVGPYDLGVITVRTALEVDPVTAQATAVSDPFPQIFQGIPVRVRDIRLDVDRPSFTLNPTSCAQKQIDAHVTGTGGNLSSTADDTGADLAERFQAASCASLGFRPKLSFRLFGGTHRGAHPKFRATLRARPGDANIAGASVALPHSEFLDQSHIKTICTRVQFAQDACPAGSIYGFAKAVTPLFDEPLQGPVYLRSSSHQLPDLVAALQGPASRPVKVELSGRIDSVNGGIRNTFDVVPDAPVSEFSLTMQGGKKGLLQNSTDICASTNRATAKFSGQNGKRITLHPKMQSACGKAKKRRARHSGR